MHPTMRAGPQHFCCARRAKGDWSCWKPTRRGPSPRSCLSAGKLRGTSDAREEQQAILKTPPLPLVTLHIESISQRHVFLAGLLDVRLPHNIDSEKGLLELPGFVPSLLAGAMGREHPCALQPASPCTLPPFAWIIYLWSTTSN